MTKKTETICLAIIAVIAGIGCLFFYAEAKGLRKDVETLNDACKQIDATKGKHITMLTFDNQVMQQFETDLGALVAAESVGGELPVLKLAEKIHQLSLESTLKRKEYKAE